jgi:hypothetical protein
MKRAIVFVINFALLTFLTATVMVGFTGNFWIR